MRSDLQVVGIRKWACLLGATIQPTTQPRLGAAHGVLSEAPVLVAEHRLTV